MFFLISSVSSWLALIDSLDRWPTISGVVNGRHDHSKTNPIKFWFIKCYFFISIKNKRFCLNKKRSSEILVYDKIITIFYKCAQIIEIKSINYSKFWYIFKMPIFFRLIFHYYVKLFELKFLKIQCMSYYQFQWMTKIWKFENFIRSFYFILFL